MPVVEEPHDGHSRRRGEQSIARSGPHVPEVDQCRRVRVPSGRAGSHGARAGGGRALRAGRRRTAVPIRCSDERGAPAAGDPVRGEHVLARRSPSHADRSRRETPESEPRRREPPRGCRRRRRMRTRPRAATRRAESVRCGAAAQTSVETGRNARKSSTASFRRLRSVRDLGPHASADRRVDGDTGTRARGRRRNTSSWRSRRGASGLRAGGGNALPTLERGSGGDGRRCSRWRP